MAHSGSVTGVLIPDPGDSHKTADSQHSTYLDALEIHDHTGGARYAKIPSAGIDINANLSANGFAITGLQYVALGTVDPALMPANSIGRDATGDFYYRPSSGAAVQITAGNALNTAASNGFDGLASPAKATYTPASGFYELFESQVNNLRGRLQLSDLRLRERTNNPAHYCDLKLPGGWDAAASADPTINIPPEADISAITSPIMMVGKVGTWAGVVKIGGVDQTTVVNRAGYTRILGRVWVDFSLTWSGGPASGAAMTIGGLPFASSTTLAATGPLLYGKTGGVPHQIFPRTLSGSTTFELIKTSDGLAATDDSQATGTVAGSMSYFI